jgi:hypothetical protein
MNVENIFYVYVILDPRKTGKYYFPNVPISFLYEPFYIGKGKGRRILAHLHASSLKKANLKNNKIKAILKNNLKPFVFKIEDGLAEKDALDKEKIYIKSIGRIECKNGTLCNHTDGGEGMSGFHLSEETKQKLRKCRLGTKASPDAIENMKKAHQRNPCSPMLGKKHSDKTKSKMRMSHVGLFSGTKHPLYGKKPTYLTRKKISDSHKKKCMHSTQKHKEILRELFSKQWEIIYPDGHNIIIKNLRKFCLDNNLNASAMVKVSKQKRKHHKNFMCVCLSP